MFEINTYMCEVTVVCVTLGASKVETCTRSVEKSEIKKYREHLSKGTRSCKLMALTCNSTDALIVYLKPKKNIKLMNVLIKRRERRS